MSILGLERKTVTNPTQQLHCCGCQTYVTTLYQIAKNVWRCFRCTEKELLQL